MRLLRRNLVEFTYEPYLGESDYDPETEEYTGEPEVQYGNGVTYRGNLSVPSGVTNPAFYGLDARYSHVILTDNPGADIRENGRIRIGDDTYEVVAIRPSLNVLAVAVQRLTKDGGA